jgi:hypothetical protein
MEGGVAVYIGSVAFGAMVTGEQEALGYPGEVRPVERAREEDVRPAGGRGLLEVVLGPLRRGRRDRRGQAAIASPPTGELIARERAQNSRSWAALRRLGVEEGAELPLRFCFDSAGPEADRALAEFLSREAGYHVVIEREGVSGRTPPMPLGPTALDAWVSTMVRAGHDHGGCPFSGWTATPKAGRP